MALRKYQPVTPGTRFRTVSDFNEITKATPEKSLLVKYSKSGGRNGEGRMTMRYVGGGHKRRLRLIDFKREKAGIPAVVASIEYDPNRTSYIALLHYADGEKRYILAPEKLKVGAKLLSGPGAEPVVGNALQLKEIPLGTVVHSIEMIPGRGAKIARGAGTFAQLTAKEGRYVVLKMPSGEVRRILSECMATIGTVGNADHMNISMGKAGRKRWLGRRPRNRAVSMNPVDHPMGGGEGRASGGHPRSRKGIPAKGYKTRNRKKNSSKFIISRRNAKNAQ